MKVKTAVGREASPSCSAAGPGASPPAPMPRGRLAIEDEGSPPDMVRLALYGDDGRGLRVIVPREVLTLYASRLLRAALRQS